MQIKSIAVLAGYVAVAVAQGQQIAAIGQCSQDCWNVSAVQANCDPNASDDCLCGTFFNLVTQCLATCSPEEALAALSVLDGGCPNE
ncbi:hypothetical protein P154DRAFT_624007 [Amniculicola lignicola CBS 123094]|uniref:CFEM domain-containing protein n=1 Tax=Amniculicola lignicola CBS 123094 TaxID=1392246 RepID=A0A6A5W8J3_9PLEO|nr:hypothetical protein P154DRAFT_624007 [Amniculicola lignicola CBS 123094]